MKAVHRFLTIIAAVVLAMAICPASALADSGSGLTAGETALEANADDIASGVSGTCTWTIESGGAFVVRPTSGDVGTLGTWDETFYVPWYDYRYDITSARFEGTVVAQTCRGLFYDCGYLTSVDLTGLDTSNVTDMTNMFDFCGALTSLNLADIDTSNVTSMCRMFFGCSELTSLDLSSFDTSQVTDMYCMFCDCQRLTYLNLSGWDTSNVTDMNTLFGNCCKITSLDLSSFDTSNVKDMNDMFGGCNNLYSVDLSNFITSNVTDMGSMFSSCFSLSSLDLSTFDTSRVTNMSYMFSYCESLSYLNLSKWNTSSVIYMNSMFDDCWSLKSLNLSSFNTSRVEDMSKMFEYCMDLKTVYVGDKWTVTSKALAASNDVFYDCFNLVGGNGTGYDNAHVGAEYARVDSATTPGYFTRIAGGGSSTCKVKFNPNGGSVSTTSKTVVQGTACGKMPTPTKSGYYFKGWYTGKSGGSKVTASTVIKKTMTVYAHWGARTSIAKAKVTVKSATYSGTAKKPGVTVKLGTKTLKGGTDYKVAYSNNVNASSKAVAKVTGIGKYKGSATKYFTIKRHPMDDAITAKVAVDSTPYTGKEIKPGIAVYFNGKKMKKGTDYKVSYLYNKQPGRAEIMVTGMGNFTSTARLFGFTITKADQPIKLSMGSISKKYRNIGESVTFTVSGVKELASVTVASSNTKVATVAKSLAKFKVTIKGVGKADITVKTKATKHYKATTKKLAVTVVDRKTPTITMPASVTRKTTDTGATISAVPKCNSDGALTYASSNPSVATVGKTTGKIKLTGAVGEATITCTSAATKNYKAGKGTMKITVRMPMEPEPDFTHSAYNNPANPYAPDYLNQCTSFAWARVMEAYGDLPNLNMAWSSNGKDWAATLVACNPQYFTLVTKAEVDADPTLLKDGSVYSVSYQGDGFVGSDAGHVGVISKWDPSTKAMVTNDGNFTGGSVASINGTTIYWMRQDQVWDAWGTNAGTPFTARYYNNLVFAVPK